MQRAMAVFVVLLMFIFYPGAGRAWPFVIRDCLKSIIVCLEQLQRVDQLLLLALEGL